MFSFTLWRCLLKCHRFFHGMQGKMHHTGRRSRKRRRRDKWPDESAIGDDDMGTSCLSDSGLAAVGRSFVKLEKLSLIWCSNLTDVGLKSFAEQCGSLKSLDLQVTA